MGGAVVGLAGDGTLVRDNTVGSGKVTGLNDVHRIVGLADGKVKLAGNFSSAEMKLTRPGSTERTYNQAAMLDENDSEIGEDRLSGRTKVCPNGYHVGGEGLGCVKDDCPPGMKYVQGEGCVNDPDIPVNSNSAVIGNSLSRTLSALVLGITALGETLQSDPEALRVAVANNIGSTREFLEAFTALSSYGSYLKEINEMLIAHPGLGEITAKSVELPAEISIYISSLTDMPIAGMKMALETPDGILEAVSGADGILDFGRLNPGVYPLKQAEPSEGFYPDTGVHSISVAESGHTALDGSIVSPLALKFRRIRTDSDGRGAP
jgi:hypothetical protein